MAKFYIDSKEILMECIRNVEEQIVLVESRILDVERNLNKLKERLVFLKDCVREDEKHKGGS